MNLIAASCGSLLLLQVLQRVDECVSVLLTARQQNATLRTLRAYVNLNVIPLSPIGRCDAAPILRIAQLYGGPNFPSVLIFPKYEPGGAS